MVTVIGLGFVGLTTALGIAELGTPVFGYEIDSEKATRIKEQLFQSRICENNCATNWVRDFL